MVHSATPDVTVLSWKTPTGSDTQAAKIAQFMGAETVSASLSHAMSEGAGGIPSTHCLLVHIEVLASFVGIAPHGLDDLPVLLDDFQHVFVYGFVPARHERLLSALSSGALGDVASPDPGPAPFTVAGEQREWCGAFAGLSFGRSDSRRDATFIDGPESRAQIVLVRLGDRPFVVRTKLGRSEVFLSGCSELADLDALCDGDLLPWFSRLVPLMMFLRGALGCRVWRNPRSQACFIVDDPLLRGRYGFLEYGALVKTMRAHRFSTSIAFIPWNFRRSRPKVAAVFLANPALMSLCVHGCDHTGAEFGTTDGEALEGQAQLALERMQAHRRFSGVPFDDVMVFPQGVFTSKALKAVRACGFLAAVNSHLTPSDQTGTLTLRDCIDVAVMRFEGFPLFGRRYPVEPAEFAFDIFLGKPALVVEHHGYFRDGHAALSTFVDRLNALDANLEWTNLATICSQACLAREDRDGERHVRFYGSRFRLENQGKDSRTYHLLRRTSNDGAPPSVTADGKPCEATRDGHDLRITLSLEPGRAAHIHVLPPASDAGQLRRRRPTTYRARVFVRRWLSEFRDNHVDTRPIFAGLASAVRAGITFRRPSPNG